MYMVISMPNRKSIALGVSHFMAVSCYWAVHAILRNAGRRANEIIMKLAS
jgi:hypothetical protein